jgi:hypothetical protein
MLDEQDEIEHRLWRGQVTLLLPMVDSIRFALCERWTARFGDDWPSRWQPPLAEEEAKAVKHTPYASGWGHIKSLLLDRSIYELDRERTSLRQVSHAHYVRNSLAHYRPVTFQDFEILWQTAGTD